MEVFYDLIKEGQRVREQLQQDPSPVVEARNAMSQTILINVLQALSDSGFYEYLSRYGAFNVHAAAEKLQLDFFVFDTLMDYLVGRGLLEKENEKISITSRGEIFFNAYSRGLFNVYWGGYKAIFYHLGSVLQKKIALEDTRLNRSSFHAATGTSQLTCGFTIPKVLELIDSQNCRYVLDLGCGTGDFLTHIARLNSNLKGIGIDSSAEAVVEAKKRADNLSLGGRLLFFMTEVGNGRLAVPSEFLEKVDIVTCMYMLHEFGRDGEGAIVQILKSLKKQLVGKLFLILETEECTSEEASQKEHYGPLDYRLIHILSRQGLPRKPRQWCDIFQEANCSIIEPGVRIGSSYVYIVRF